MFTFYLPLQEMISLCFILNLLVGLMVKVFALTTTWDAIRSFFVATLSGQSHTRELKTETQVAALPGAWRCRVSVVTRWHGVSLP